MGAKEHRKSMQLYFIRHGQSENNLLWAKTGSSKGRSVDPGLTPVGRQQAHRVAEFLRRTDSPVPVNPGQDPQDVAGFGITHLYTSLMIRAVATGTVIARVLGLPLVGWTDLHEWGGIYRKDEQTGERTGLPGKNRSYFEAHYPELVLPDSMGKEGWWNRPFEEREERPLRAKRFLRDLLDRHGGTDDRVAAISHGGFHSQLLWTVLDVPREKNCWFALNNAAMTRIDLAEEEIVLGYLNRVDFLPKELIT
jgi:2,3-bisphosphoglycerate-dependent phosphoglycerate mutase